MGIYLNPSNTIFQRALNSEIYVDKSMLIDCTNRVINTEQCYVSVSRPRRFGKSITANMLTAYYSRGCDSREMFSNLKISKDEKSKERFEKHLNKYNVIRVNMADFLGQKSTDKMLDNLSRKLLHELKKEFGDVDCFDWNDLISVLEEIFLEKEIPFIFIIDEWDCVFRERQDDTDAQKAYLDFLRKLFKDKSYVALVYMTGILPIKKYGKHSAINMFTEVSMTNPHEYAEFTGFTEEEVKELCRQYDMPFDETKRWYDGYNLKGISVYNPRSVVMSMAGHDFDNYWTSTETYEALKIYIEMNFDGLKDTIINLMSGEKAVIDTTTFSNDMVTFTTKDDVLTLLIHLGYLTYDFDTKEISIPNYEIMEQFASTIKVIGWSEIANSLKRSDDLLSATLSLDEEKVANFIDQAHSDNASILKYNSESQPIKSRLRRGAGLRPELKLRTIDENSLACVVSIAYYSARRTYFMYREAPSGKGYADIIFVPRRNVTTPALVIELKYNQSADSAIEQIKERKYTDFLKDYTGEILLVGINYDKNDPKKKHMCRIEKVVK